MYSNLANSKFFDLSVLLIFFITNQLTKGVI
jgi:hypothetical protein